MDFPRFLRDLCEEGRVIVPPISTLTPEELESADEFLRLLESEYRQRMAETPPAFDLVAARWAAIIVYRACQFVVYRDYGPEVMDQHLATAECNSSDSAAHYSVDLTLRFLPDIFRFAKSAAEDDPLLDQIRRIAREWPLSSVGMGELAGFDIDGFVDDPSLLGLYVDRIIDCRDTSRLSDPRVAEAAQQAVGEFSDLAPEIASVLSNSD